MFRILTMATVATFLSLPIAAKPFSEFFPDMLPDMTQEDLKLVEGLDFQQGDITIGNGLATLAVSEDFYYLNPNDSAYVLETIG